VRFDSAAYARRPLDGGPFGVALGGDVLVVTKRTPTRSGVGSLAARTVVGGVPVGSIPTDVSVNAAGTEAYVTNQFGSSLGIVDVARRTQVAAVALPYNPYRSILSRDERRVWVTTNTGPIYAVDVAARRVVDSLPGVGPTNGFAIAPGDTLAYSSNYGGEVREFDLRTRAVRRVFRAPGVLQEVVVAGDGREVYVANESGFVEVFDVGTGTASARLSLGQVFGMALGPDGRTLFVARTLDGTVAAIDRTTRARCSSIRSAECRGA
jgi:DNA-binding beta-propeller fold protein YncE